MVDANPADFHTDEIHIEQWKVKRLIKRLQSAKGNGTSFVSLYIPAGDPVTKHMQLLASELAGAESIKSRQTRQSVLAAITSTREMLKLYKNTPTNGLCLFCGVILQEDGKSEKKNENQPRTIQAYQRVCVQVLEHVLHGSDAVPARR
mmetsp:Transcript_29780/g.39615  ORF Transcript_29780/g.39615 Transcript_29780/m.39615 type:complete len:148 (+) Transcript_29780:21-464(+)